jgi:hypothetical protein
LSWLPCVTECPLWEYTSLLFLLEEWFGVRHLLEGKTHLQHQWLWGDCWTEQGWSRVHALSA